MKEHLPASQRPGPKEGARQHHYPLTFVPSPQTSFCLGKRHTPAPGFDLTEPLRTGRLAQNLSSWTGLLTKIHVCHFFGHLRHCWWKLAILSGAQMNLGTPERRGLLDCCFFLGPEVPVFCCCVCICAVSSLCPCPCPIRIEPFRDRDGFPKWMPPTTRRIRGSRFRCSLGQVRRDAR